MACKLQLRDNGVDVRSRARARMAVRATKPSSEETCMRKHLAVLGAGLVLLAAQGSLFAADSTSNPTQTNPQATPTERPASAASDKSNRPENEKDQAAYQAQLKKCDGMSNAADKKACTEK